MGFRNFQLKLDLLRGSEVVASGFSDGVVAEGRRLHVRARLESGGRVFYLFGRLYSPDDEQGLQRWVDRFPGEQVEAWARGVDGEWVVVVFDPSARRVTLISDRTGAVRAFYSNRDGTVALSSSRLEIIPLLSSPRLSPPGCFDLLTAGFTLDPASLLEGVQVTQPGEVVLCAPEGTTVKRYYSPVKFEVDYFRDEAEAVAGLGEGFSRVFGKHARSSRSPCVLLSGGIDSLAMLRYVQEASAEPVQTVTFSFEGLERNELLQGEIAARHARTEHRALIISTKEIPELLLRCLLEADTPDNPVMYMAVRGLLERTGEAFDVYTGQDSRLHTPSFELPKEVGVRVHQSGWVDRPLGKKMLGAAVELGRRWPVPGQLKNYLATWAHYLTPRQDARTFLLEGLVGFRRPEEWIRHSASYQKLFEEVPPIGPQDSLQTVYKKYASFRYRLQDTDDMACGMSSLTGSRVEAHFPFYDWEFVEMSNRMPYYIGTRRVFTTRSWSKLPVVQKKVLRRLLRGRVPEELLYRSKATRPVLHVMFNSALRGFVDRILSAWGNELVEQVGPEVGRLVDGYRAALAARSRFEVNRDEDLLQGTLAVTFLSVLNRRCHESAIAVENGLREMCERASRAAA